VIGPITAPFTSFSTDCGPLDALSSANRNTTLPVDNYDRLVIVWRDPACAQENAGAATLGSRSAVPVNGVPHQLAIMTVMDSDDRGSLIQNVNNAARVAPTFVHEFAHTLGLFHAAELVCPAASAPTCSTSELGDGADPLGGGAFSDGDLNAAHKDMLGWLDRVRVQELRAHD
jgi:hypothetical protein